ncbi:MAG: hypothetical protein KAT04_03785 [Methylococcales bacterium]|nr:hypothetical protein [Methylococcales bacterium]
MKIFLFPFIFLSLLVSGCTSVKYQGLDAAAFSDGSPESREVSFLINYNNVKYNRFLQKQVFDKYLTEELSISGFNQVGKGIVSKGFSVEAIINLERSTDWLSFFAYMITLSIYPASGDNIVSFDVDYYKDKEKLRSVTYQGSYVDYVSAYFPTPLFMGDSANDFMRKLATDLADNIARDFPDQADY